MELSNAQQEFILHWGEMGSRWGINRVIGQIHAVLLCTERPAHAQEICEVLQVARSNVSTGLRELQGWGLIRCVHIKGDRREHFEADRDVWSMMSKIANRRLEREILPTLEVLKNLRPQAAEPPQFRKVIDELVTLFESGTGLYRKLSALPQPLVKRFLKLDKQIEKILRRE